MTDPSHASSRRLDKGRRIRRRGEFQRVFDAGQRTKGRFLTVLAAAAPSGKTRLGIVASKKLGNAVRRNRAKRLIREIFRASAPSASSPGLDIVVIPRVELFDASFATLERDFRAVLARCSRGAVTK